MADTKRGWWPEKFCAICGKQGCIIYHTGQLMRGAIVFLCGCRAPNVGGEISRFNCGTGERLIPVIPEDQERNIP